MTDFSRPRNPCDDGHSSMSLMFVALLAASTSHSAVSALDSHALSGRTRYERCVQLVQRSPGEALNAALAWQGSGGNVGAEHCAALALVALKRYPEAARTLDELGHQNFGGASERASIFDQAGNAWLLAGQGTSAMQSFTSALALSPRDPDIIADHARAAAMLGDWFAAEHDLSAALAIDPYRADMLVLRASARHALGRMADARADLEAALRIVPNYPDALVSRGALKLETGDANGARADWQTVVTRVPGSAAGEEARQRLSQMAPAK